MIETTITKIQYDADGVQRRWSIPFPYADVKYISIYTKIGDEPTVKVVDNYDIDKDDSVVIYPTVASGQEPLSTGTKITIARETPETQLEDSSQIHFTSKDVERGLDKLTMITQELSTTASETMEVSADAFEAAEEAVNSAAQANRTAEEAKTIAGQAVGIATDAKSIAEGIDAKAVQALDNSNTAINTANSAKETAEGIDGKATQALTNSTTALETATEAKNTADSYQGQITTIRNDVDDLGDQVSNIESKIPAEASERNPLADKNYVDNNIPQGVYTQSNLLAGKDIEIIDEPVEGGIDNHTLACWHFDEDFRDVISNIILPNGTLTAEHKFGSHGYSFGWPSSTEKVVTLNREKDFTIDFFIQLTNANTNLAWDGYFQGYSAQSLIVVHQDKLYMATTNGSTTSINLPNPLQLNTWNHIAFVYSFENKIISAFVNGDNIGQLATTYPVADFNLNNFNGRTPWYIDELRISDIARQLNPDGKFPVPARPYSLAVPTGNRVINNTITKTSQLTNDSGFITDVPVATTTVAGKMKADGTTITVTEDGTISAVTPSIDLPSDVYTQSNLLAGKNITIEEVLPEGGIDGHTLACFHCDGNVDDATNNKYITLNRSFTDSEFYNVTSPRFGSASLTPGGAGYDRIFTNNTILLSTFTLDLWMKKSRSSRYVTMSLPDNYVFNQDTWKFYKANQPDTILISSISTPDNSNWHHFAFTYEPNKICIFIDGILQGDCKRTSDNFYLGAVNFNGTYDLDEIRFSDIARPLNPDGKFPVPTKPYSLAVPTGNKVINNTITKTSQLINDSGFITDVPVATASSLGGVKPDGNTITVTEDGTISASVSGEGLATKAELQDRVAKAGDTMSGTLNMSGASSVRFGTDDNFYYIRRDANSGSFLIYASNNKGLFLGANEQHKPYYWDGTQGFLLLTTADLANIDYVVESQVNADGSWYRKYKSGWLEQGGLVTVSGTVGATVTLLKPFTNTAYNIQLTLQTTNAVGYLANTAQSVNIANSKTITSFSVQTAGINNYEINGISWRAEGQGGGAVTPEPSPEPKPILHKYAWRTADNTLVYADVKELARNTKIIAYVSPYTNGTFEGESVIENQGSTFYNDYKFISSSMQDIEYSHEVTE